MVEFILSISSPELLAGSLILLMGLIPTTAGLIWRFARERYKDQLITKDERILYLQERLGVLENYEPKEQSLESWTKAYSEIQAMEKILLQRLDSELESKDKTYLATIKDLKREIIELEFTIDMLEAGIQFFVENGDKAIAYSTMVETGGDPEARHVKAFLADGDLKGKVGILKEAKRFIAETQTSDDT